MFILGTVQPARLGLAHLTPGFGWHLPSSSRITWGFLPVRGAESSTGLGVRRAGWCLGLGGFALTQLLSQACWMALAEFLHLWSSSFPVKVSKSLPTC